MQYQIYWTPQTQLLELQGATVDFRAVDAVFYEHYFLPSGQAIAVWHSKHHYTQQQKISDLPQLTPGKTYTITRHIENSERMFAYLVVTFYDQQHQILLTNSQNHAEITVTVPENYDFYTIAVHAAGAGHFIFQDVMIQPTTQGVLRANDTEIAPRLYSDLQIPATLTSKTLRVVFSEPERGVTDYASAWIRETQQAVQYIASSLPDAAFYRQHEDATIISIKSARKQAHARHLEFVGYGPISSYAALYYQSQFKGSAAVISEDVNLAPSPTLKIARTVDKVGYLGHPIAPNHDIPVLLPHPATERLDGLHYDTPTPEEVRRQAAYDAAHPQKRGLTQFFTKNKKTTP